MHIHIHMHMHIYIYTYTYTYVQVSFLCRPGAYTNPRMLVVHRTGSGKTATMIQLANNYFLDRRPKLLIFPTPSVCANFYRELRDPKFPNRYASYLRRLDEARQGGWRPGDAVDTKKSLELHGILKHGCVAREYLEHDVLPSAPLRAFSYTQAGGAQSCGEHINAIFRCPDGYAGSYNPNRRSGPLPRVGGYPEFPHTGNPFSNKVILMDEVHNLVRPSAEILRNPKRMEMLRRLRHLISTAENSVVIGFTGTPLCDDPKETSSLKSIIKGAAAAGGRPSGGHLMLCCRSLKDGLPPPGHPFHGLPPPVHPSHLPTRHVDACT